MWYLVGINYFVSGWDKVVGYICLGMYLMGGFILVYFFILLNFDVVILVFLDVVLWSRLLLVYEFCKEWGLIYDIVFNYKFVIGWNI